MTAAETVLATLLDRYALAVRAKDLAAFTRLYADEVVVFDPFDSWTISGLANWRASTAVWFAALGEQPIAVTHSQVRAQRHGDLLAGHAWLAYSSPAHAGRIPRTVGNRCTLVARQQGDDWLIVHEHNSLPIRMDPLQPMFAPPNDSAEGKP